MSYGNPQPCKNQCGAWIYFDKDSVVGHPSTDKWLPLEYNHDSGIKTGKLHQCAKRSSSSTKTSSTPIEQVSEGESVLHTEMLKLLEQSHNLLASCDGKLDRLLNLIERGAKL